MIEDIPKRSLSIVIMGTLILLIVGLKPFSPREIIIHPQETPYKSDATPNVAQDLKGLMTKKALAKGLDEKDINILTAIIQAESGWRQYEKDGIRPLRGRVHPADVGLFQINTAESAHGPEIASSSIDVWNTDGNLEFGLNLYKRKGTQPWIASEHNWKKYLKVVTSTIK